MYFFECHCSIFFFKTSNYLHVKLLGQKVCTLRFSLILANCPPEKYAHLNSCHQFMRQSVAYILAKLEHYESY